MSEKHNLNNLVEKLFAQQINEWPLMSDNYKGLTGVKTKNFSFDGYSFRVQFNPARIKSSAAKVDKKSINERPCFLCAENRPQEQRSVGFNDFLILINPFPIFPNHLTISHKEHIPQLIRDKIKDMFNLATALPDYTIFYNGARCGASAPDHFHFQAGNRYFMPIDNEIEEIKTKYGKSIKKQDCWKVNDGIRKFFVLESANKNVLGKTVNELLNKLQDIKHSDNEPDINVLCSFENGKWRIIIFPRMKHRPWQFFADGEDNIIFSPASVDFGGLVICPLEKDFEKMNKELLTDLMRQVGWENELFEKINI